MSKKIKSEWTPEELDHFLQKNYSFSLYHFVCSLDDVFSLKDYRIIKMKESPNKELPWRDFWLGRIKNLKKLKKYNRESIKILNELFQKADKYLMTYLRLYPEKLMALKLNDISEQLNDLIKHIKEHYLIRSKRKGKPAEKINILFLVWTHFVKKEKTHVRNTLNLLNWLSARIDEFDFLKSDFFEQNFTKELYRYRKGKLKNVESIIEEYKERFLVPVRHEWLEQCMKGLDDLDAPVIVFSNGEELTSRHCIANNPSYKKFLDSKIDIGSLISYDFKNSTPEDEGIIAFISEDEYEEEWPSFIDQELLLEESVKEGFFEIDENEEFE